MRSFIYENVFVVANVPTFHLRKHLFLSLIQTLKLDAYSKVLRSGCSLFLLSRQHLSSNRKVFISESPIVKLSSIVIIFVNPGFVRNYVSVRPDFVHEIS